MTDATMDRLQTARSGLPRAKLVAFGVAGTCIVAHIAATGRYMTVRGPLLVLDHGFDVLGALILLALATGVGTRSLQLGGVALESAVERLVFGAALGSGLMATALLATLALAGVNDATIALTMALLAVFARRDLAAFPALLRGVGHEVFGAYGRGVGRLLALALSAATAMMLLLALLPPVEWDSLMYHVDVPLRWLRGGRLALPPDNLHAAFVGAIHLMYIPLLAAGSLAGPAVLNSLFAVLLALAVWAAGRTLFSRPVGAWAAAILWASPILVLVAGSPRVDVTLALFLFLAQYALLRAIHAPPANGMLGVSAALMGLAFGVKALALPFALGLAPLVIWTLLRVHEGYRQAVPGAARYLAIATLAAAPWMIKNALLVGAPLYPALSAPHLEPWLRALVPPRERLTLALGSSTFIRSERVPFNVIDFFLRPWRITPGGEAAAYFGNLLFILLPLAFLGTQRRRVLLLLGPALLYAVALSIAGAGYLNVRYLIPALPQLTLASALAVREGGRRLPSRGLRRSAIAVVAGLGILLSLVPVARIVGTRAGSFAVGILSRADVLNGFAPISDYYRVSTWANRSLGAGSATLMLGEARGVYFHHRMFADGLIQNWSVLRRYASSRGCLRDLGLTHVLVNDEVLDYYDRRGADLSTLGWSEFAPYARRCLRPVFRAGGVTLYRIRPAGAASAMGLH